MPYPVSHLCLVDDEYLFAATHEGVVCHSLNNGKTTLRHEGFRANALSVCDGKIYIVFENKMIVENPDGSSVQEYPLPAVAQAFYKVGNMHYFVSPSCIRLSADLKNFTSIPLRHNIPGTSHNSVLPDDGNGFSLMITDNAVWKIPHHLGVFNGDAPVLSSCYSETGFYYLNNRNELFIQSGGKGYAKKIYDFSTDNAPTDICAIGNTIYYCNANNKLYCADFGSSHLINELFVRPKTIYQSGTRITAMSAVSATKKILLGLQDFLLSIDTRTGHVDTLQQINNKYVTAISHVPHSEDIYVSTLNDGIFCLSGDEVYPVKDTERYAFIHDLLVNNGYERNILFLTNHKLLSLGADSIEANGNKRLFLVNDSIIYTIPEAGVHKYIVRGKKLKDCGVLYADIRFNARAGFVRNNRLYLGSDLGMAVLSPSNEKELEWITFDDKVVNMQFILLITLAVILIVALYFFSRHRRHRSQKRQLQARIDDLRRRAEGLNAMLARLDEKGKTSIADINGSIDQIDINTTNIVRTNEQIKQISDRIMRLNRDTALQMVKVIDRQIEEIRDTGFYERTLLVKESERARNSEDVDLIISQSSRNELWLNHVHDLEERIRKFRLSTDGTMTLPGINEQIAVRLDKITEDCHHKPLSEVHADFITIRQEYEQIFSDKALESVRQYITTTRNALKDLRNYHYVVAELATELEHIEKEIDVRDRIIMLRTLHGIDERLKQIRLLVSLYDLMQEYACKHNAVVKENEARRMRKFESKLFDEISMAARDTTSRIASCIVQLYDSFCQTDREVMEEILRFNGSGSQQVKVLMLLLADPKVKRTLLPGMIGVLGNLNPVISRLYHGKIGENLGLLKAYCDNNPYTMIYYLLKLVE
ncbi:hypothetical protein [Prevotella sp. OH937_COT-195]|uniref:hypothetical protein n=1 Tax=Prevotella sp. OH937_COT-195 TaxID=2491051 RepID=UPI000F655665|nr:hypothetical protein [Prevotella sp. OH937_COT-195]RRD02739.1 flagellar protein FliS [Prevotella sp. OH937_COT-195]